jgi:hypothetical protein
MKKQEFLNLKIGDIVSSNRPGKDKGKKGIVTRIFPKCPKERPFSIKTGMATIWVSPLNEEFVGDHMTKGDKTKAMSWMCWRLES